mgnify:CR=1 FL=1
MESAEKNTFEAQLADLEKELVDSWHLDEMAAEIIRDAKHIPVGGGKTYDVGWGNFMVGRSPNRFVVDILTKKGQEAINHETHHLEN